MNVIGVSPDVSAYIDGLVERAARLGVRLKVKTDFRELQETVDAIEDRARLTPIFDWRYTDISEENGFWVEGTAEDGCIVHLIASRIDELGDETLARYLRNRAALFLSDHIPAIPEQSDFGQCVSAREIHGRVSYIGENWISPKGGFRGKGLVSVLSRLHIARTYEKWAPDFIYSMVASRLIARGYGARIGYFHAHPLGVRWKLKDDEPSFNEYLTWLERREMRDFIHAPL